MNLLMAMYRLITFMTALIPETFQVLIFKLYLSPLALSFSQPKSMVLRSESTLFIIVFGASTLAFFGAGSSSLSSSRFVFFAGVVAIFGDSFEFLVEAVFAK